MATTELPVSSPALPPTHLALRQDVYAQPPTVQSVPTPQPVPGSAVFRVTLASIIGYTRDIYNGVRKYPYPVPLTLGSSAIGRVVALAPDATILEIGDLCLLDCTIRGRDDIDGSAASTFLSAISEGFSEGSKKLMRDAWRDGTYAEYVRWPLENCFRLDEKKLFAMGYTVEDLMYIPRMLVAYGGFSPLCIDLKPGETVVIGAATGGFGSAAVHLALEMGAGRVIALGRNTEILEKVKNAAAQKDRVFTVPLTGDWEVDYKALKDVGGTIDIFFDISPGAAQGSGHIKAGIMALRHGGRCCLMGGIRGDVSLPHHKIMHGDITVKGKWMYEPQDVKRLIGLVEMGLVRLNTTNQDRSVKPLGAECKGKFSLEKWEEAFEVAHEVTRNGFVVFEP
ncbi:uncharacterized protein Z518_08043 [Rhinocladiella mackenziei CBS 650.93]|uniref:Rhinocladiella mackenziei CBS 650.93 unplaced genomic scaffold supercont1.6, whole genome shotgun sequence n=1 Tax=Rhinocladiella mackenziei CBS 650.93 TaxID=1442369 RepID=A0A0D2I8B9_9EURO|nr:uncharacterized protein Z518_08043 [Rhinocladiella mackenziei CBS 650.93]KIX02104.1 hypothetical protein Z518_08043 [Rhinocladiella mackenziei CBS 650.93]